MINDSIVEFNRKVFLEDKPYARPFKRGIKTVLAPAVDE